MPAQPAAPAQSIPPPPPAPAPTTWQRDAPGTGTLTAAKCGPLIQTRIG